MIPVRKPITPNSGTVDLSQDDYRFTPSIKDVHFDVHYTVDHHIPTLSDVADHDYLALEESFEEPLAEFPADDAAVESIKETLDTGTIRLSPDLLQQIVKEMKAEVMAEVKTLLRTAISRQVCQTVGIATKDLRKRIQNEVESTLPELVSSAVAQHGTHN